MRRVLTIFLVLNICTINYSLANTNYNYQPIQVQQNYSNQYYQQPLQYPQNNTLQGNVVMVPAGATVYNCWTNRKFSFKQ